MLARHVVIASGADYHRLPGENAHRSESSGRYYAATHLEALQTAGEDVVAVVGGGNSAGQAGLGAPLLEAVAKNAH